MAVERCQACDGMGGVHGRWTCSACDGRGYGSMPDPRDRRIQELEMEIGRLKLDNNDNRERILEGWRERDAALARVRELEAALGEVIADLNLALEDGIHKPLTVQPVLEARRRAREALAGKGRVGTGAKD